MRRINIIMFLRIFFLTNDIVCILVTGIQDHATTIYADFAAHCWR